MSTNKVTHLELVQVIAVKAIINIHMSLDYYTE